MTHFRPNWLRPPNHSLVFAASPITILGARFNANEMILMFEKHYMIEKGYQKKTFWGSIGRLVSPVAKDQHFRPAQGPPAHFSSQRQLRSRMSVPKKPKEGSKLLRTIKANYFLF